jgi:hypothetical protein
VATGYGAARSQGLGRKGEQGMHVNWAELSRFIAELLDRIYVRSRGRFQKAARLRGITVEQLAAAIITRALRASLDRAAAREP